MRIEQTFSIARAPEAVFDEMTDPARLASWQTTKTSVEQLTPGPPGLGMRVRERTKPPGGREFEQVVEFTEFDRPRRFTAHIVEGPQPIDGTWTLEPDGGGTRVAFVAEGELRGAWRLLTPVISRAMGRQFRGYHDTLRRNLEAAR
jgi:carbon monoxide dehydrogenase subunit G